MGLQLALSNAKEFHKKVQRTLDWRMHQSQCLSHVVWKDKRSILLLSTYSKPIVLEG